MEAVNKCLPESACKYEIASEHEHSLCILIAKKDFCIDGTHIQLPQCTLFNHVGQWHTWIDYDKFQYLVKTGSLSLPFGNPL